MLAIKAWQNMIKGTIALGQLTPAQEAIFQAQQPNGCYYHCTDSHPSNATLTSPGCHTLNIFKTQHRQHQGKGGVVVAMEVKVVVMMVVEEIAAVVKATTNVNLLPTTFKINNSSNHLPSLHKVNPNLTN
eukprot:13630324-Ditylum_brightwellii.AAC.1